MDISNWNDPDIVLSNDLERLWYKMSWPESIF